MKVLNRTAFVVRPKRRFVDWVNGLELDGPAMTLEEARTNASIYLVREADLDEASGLVEEYALEVFEEELASWCSDEERWPRNRTAHVFRDWFDVEHIDLVTDLEDTPLDDEDVDLGEVVHETLKHCAWCDRELDDEGERFSLALTSPTPSESTGFEGPLLAVPLSGLERPVVGLVPTPDSDARAKCEHVLFTLCSEICADELKRAFERDRSTRRDDAFDFTIKR